MITLKTVQDLNEFSWIIKFVALCNLWFQDSEELCSDLCDSDREKFFWTFVAFLSYHLFKPELNWWCEVTLALMPVHKMHVTLSIQICRSVARFAHLNVTEKEIQIGIVSTTSSKLGDKYLTSNENDGKINFDWNFVCAKPKSRIWTLSHKLTICWQTIVVDDF